MTETPGTGRRSSSSTTGRSGQHFLPVTARHVMEDVAAWWIRALLKDSNVNRLQEVLETILPGILPLMSQSVLATQLKLLSLWQEVLFHTHLQGDFALLQDKFLLLAKDFGKSPASDRCMQLLKVHEVLGHFYESLRTGKPSTDHLVNSLKALYPDKAIPADLVVLFQPIGEEDDIHSLQAHMEAMVASNSSRECTHLMYDSLRDQIQAILIEWIESAFETPLLVQLGYHMSSEAPSTTATTTTPTPASSFISSPIVRRPEGTPALQTGPTTGSERRAELPEHNPTQVEGSGSVDSEMTAEASNVDPDVNDDKESAVRKPSPSIPTRQRRRSKYQKEPQASTHEEEPQIITQLDSDQQNTPSKKTGHSLPFDDDDEDTSLDAAQQRQKRKHLNPLSPLPSLPTPVSQKKRARTISSAFEENWSPNAKEGTAVNSRHRFPLLSEGRKTSVPSPRRGRLTTSRGPKTVALSTVSRSRHTVPNEKTQNMERLRIAALALMENTKRRPFSEKENIAIMEGVSMYGSDWAAIKKHFAQTLHSRTLLHIKDRARTLIKKGKLDPAWLDEGRSTMEV